MFNKTFQKRSMQARGRKRSRETLSLKGGEGMRGETEETSRLYRVRKAGHRSRLGRLGDPLSAMWDPAPCCQALRRGRGPAPPKPFWRPPNGSESLPDNIEQNRELRDGLTSLKRNTPRRRLILTCSNSELPSPVEGPCLHAPAMPASLHLGTLRSSFRP